MDIKDLKSAWDMYSSQEMDKHRLGKESIHELLKNRTQSLVDRIDRNMRIGLGILLLFIIYLIIDSIFMSDLFSAIGYRDIEYPKWLIPIDIFSTTLIITTYLFFVIRYIKIKRSFSIQLQLKDLLHGILETLKTYRRMFYLAVVIFIINIIVSFIAGVYQGLKFKADSVSNGVITLNTHQILTIVGISLLIIVPMIALSFFALRWGFNKLYGKYLQSLSETLKELDESEIID
ncbi:hypothetical protein AQPE_3022 [Aquipluma nitroreducens]|uniref:Uncharacterized protein n=1 Tax=Aquipluma nitroreducens TaxID=2010828 RepID=A0A5K7SBB2_9BACT|nr:hypothetical protein [Aquipluma nitroreducens]BBE18852.1 hypothetical protein AQPE_3022 [Aquipluma nitroreducens]